jgi:hypothetical protein
MTTVVNVIELLSLSLFLQQNKLKLVPGKPFQPSLTFKSKIGAWSEVPPKMMEPCLTRKFKLG